MAIRIVATNPMGGGVGYISGKGASIGYLDIPLEISSVVLDHPCFMVMGEGTWWFHAREQEIGILGGSRVGSSVRGEVELGVAEGLRVGRDEGVHLCVVVGHNGIWDGRSIRLKVG